MKNKKNHVIVNPIVDPKYKIDIRGEYNAGLTRLYGLKNMDQYIMNVLVLLKQYMVHLW